MALVTSHSMAPSRWTIAGYRVRGMSFDPSSSPCGGWPKLRCVSGTLRDCVAVGALTVVVGLGCASHRSAPPKPLANDTSSRANASPAQSHAPTTPRPSTDEATSSRAKPATVGYKSTPEALACDVAQQLEALRTGCEAAEREITPDFARRVTYRVEVVACGDATCLDADWTSLGFASRPPPPSPALHACVREGVDVIRPRVQVPPGLRILCAQSQVPDGFGGALLRKPTRPPDDACASGKTRCWARAPE